jgi:hypothetical protein
MKKTWTDDNVNLPVHAFDQDLSKPLKPSQESAQGVILPNIQKPCFRGKTGDFEEKTKSPSGYYGLEAAGIEPAAGIPQVQHSQELTAKPETVLDSCLDSSNRKDPRLDNLIRVWDTLPDNIRRAVLALAGIDENKGLDDRGDSGDNG